MNIDLAADLQWCTNPRIEFCSALAPQLDRWRKKPALNVRRNLRLYRLDNIPVVSIECREGGVKQQRSMLVMTLPYIRYCYVLEEFFNGVRRTPRLLVIGKRRLLQATGGKGLVKMTDS